MFQEFRELIGMIEEFIEAKTYVLNVERMKHLQKYGYSGLELETDNSEIRDILNKDENARNEYDLMILDLLGIQILRGYLFVATYQFFESQVTLFCERVGDKLNLISFKDIHEPNVIDRCRTYLTKVAKIKIPPENLWQTISIYNKLRNSIVHSEGGIDVNQKTGKTLREYAESHPLLTFEEFDEMDGAISLEKGFCEEALNNFELFLTDLKEQLND